MLSFEASEMLGKCISEALLLLSKEGCFIKSCLPATFLLKFTGLQETFWIITGDLQEVLVKFTGLLQDFQFITGELQDLCREFLDFCLGKLLIFEHVNDLLKLYKMIACSNNLLI